MILSAERLVSLVLASYFYKTQIYTFVVLVFLFSWSLAVAMHEEHSNNACVSAGTITDYYSINKKFCVVIKFFSPLINIPTTLKSIKIKNHQNQC